MNRAVTFISSLFFLTILIPVSVVYGAEESGINFDDTIQLGDTALVLNGTGLRRKWFISIYAAGLYLPEKSDNVDDILSIDAPKRIRMHFIFSEVSKERLLKTLDTGFKDNHTQAQLDTIADEILQLKSLFQTVSQGDEVVLDYIPDAGTHLFFNTQLQGVISGFQFHQALLRVWLGNKPADKKLKNGLLGIIE